MQSIESTENRSDADLLTCFADLRDETAFAELVRRHGRMVWGVCRRRLDRREDAEDAFQATFLILAVKVRSIRAPSALPGWLHRTATRMALRHASATAHDFTEEPPADGLEAFAELARKEAVAAIDEELLRLPRRYREAIVLFHLEGLDRKQVAARLGVSEITVKALLARGRSLLRSRLARRGVALPLLLPLAVEPVPAEAAASTTRAAVSFARSGLAPIDLLSVTTKGLPPMLSWITNKSAVAALVAAAGLSLFLVVRAANADGDATGESRRSLSIDTALAQADDASTDESAEDVTVEVAENESSTPPAGNTLRPGTQMPRFEVAKSLAEHKIREELDEETQLAFPNTPLRTALEHLSKTHAINIIIDETALADEGISIDDPVDITLDGVSLDSGLNILLDPYGLTYAIKNDVMVITTTRVTERETDVRAYDVAGVIQQQTVRQPEQIAELLRSLLAPHVIPGSGDQGQTIEVIGNRLLVKASLADHRRISEILRLLPATGAGNASATYEAAGGPEREIDRIAGVR